MSSYANSFAYDIPDRPASYPNLREAASVSWRGLTATVLGKPYLIVDRVGDVFTLEGENGVVLELENFDYAPGTDQSKLVAATRIAGSPFKEIGTLVFEDGEWFVARAGEEQVLPIEDMVTVLASHNYMVEDYQEHLAGTGLNGTFIDSITGEPVEFHSVDHEPKDKSAGIEESWELKGSDGNIYFLVGDEIQDEQGNPVSQFDPYHAKTADSMTDLYTDQEKKALKCPNCGSHTLRAFDISKGKAEMKCLTCGNEFSTKVHRNPESKVALDQGGEQDYHSTPSNLSYPSEPEAQQQLIELMRQISAASEAGDQVRVAQLQQQFEALLGGNPHIQNSAPTEQYRASDVTADWKAPEGSRSDNHFIETATFTQKEALGYQPMQQMAPAQQAPINQDPTAAPLAMCPQCGAQGLNTLTGVCSNCGYTNPQLVHPTSPQNGVGAYSHTSKFVDSAGEELKTDGWYIMQSRDYKVPDVIRVVKIDDNKIEAHFESDVDGKFPLQIEASEGLSFDPYKLKEDPEVIDDKAIEATSGWKVSRRNFSPKEQEDLINENMEGRARNFDQLKLDGTHYNTRSNIVEESTLDNDFLW